MIIRTYCIWSLDFEEIFFYKLSFVFYLHAHQDKILQETPPPPRTCVFLLKPNLRHCFGNPVSEKDFKKKNPYREFFLFKSNLRHCFDFRAERMSVGGGEFPVGSHKPSIFTAKCFQEYAFGNIFILRNHFLSIFRRVGTFGEPKNSDILLTHCVCLLFLPREVGGCVDFEC